MIEQIIRQCLASWEEIYPGTRRPAGLDPVLQSRNQAIVFLFPAGSNARHPALVSKIARTSADSPRLNRCAELVGLLRARLTGDVLETVPPIIVAGSIQGLTHLVMPFLPGQPMSVAPAGRRGPKAAEQSVRAFAAWLSGLQRQTNAGRHALGEADWRDFFARKLVETASLDGVAELRGACDTLSAELAGVSMPLAWRYGDAHHSNLLLQDGRVTAAVDWMGTEAEQWAICDWFYFLFMYAVEFFKKNYRLEGKPLVHGAIEALSGCGDTWLARLYRAETIRFLEGHCLEPRLAPALSAAFLFGLYWPADRHSLVTSAAQVYAQQKLAAQ